MRNNEKPLYISQESFHLIMELGIETGSRVFGGVTEGSDFDYIISPTFPITFSDLVYEHGFRYDHSYYNEYDEFRSLKGLVGEEEVVNLLVMGNDHYFKKWTRATDLMKKICEDPFVYRKITKSKYARVRLFEALKEVLE